MDAFNTVRCGRTCWHFEVLTPSTLTFSYVFFLFITLPYLPRSPTLTPSLPLADDRAPYVDSAARPSLLPGTGSHHLPLSSPQCQPLPPTPSFLPRRPYISRCRALPAPPSISEGATPTPTFPCEGAPLTTASPRDDCRPLLLLLVVVELVHT